MQRLNRWRLHDLVTTSRSVPIHQLGIVSRRLILGTVLLIAAIVGGLPIYDENWNFVLIFDDCGEFRRGGGWGLIVEVV